MIAPSGASNFQELTEVAAHLIEKAGISGRSKLTPLQGGRNNRVFHVGIGDASFLLKSYFRHEKDPRDRLGAEFSFLSYAWTRGLRMIPRPIAADAAHALGLYEFIDGRKLAPGDIGMGHVGQALDFFFALNGDFHDPEARRLPLASEACFSMADHFSLVDRRLKRLAAIEAQDGFEETFSFVHERLFKTWGDLHRSILERAMALGIDLDEQLSPEKRVLSPSDFGFHNAILEREGRLRFLDFEYAGWDDPAKMVCDFFCQPEVPLPSEYYSVFRERVVEEAGDGDDLRNRIHFLLPVYRIKWCCIMLNDFLPVGDDRRGFSNQPASADRKRAQLDKARRYFRQWIEVGEK
jgi:hypothetical protein